MQKTCENWLKNSLHDYILWKNSNNITINFENFCLGVLSAIKTKVPFQKVALVLSQKSFCLYGEKLRSELNKIDNKVITLILDDKELNQQNANKIFSLPEDVRAVIVFNNEFFDLASYYATFTKSILVSVYANMEFYDCFKKTIYFNEQNVLYPYNIDCEISYVFDVNSIVNNPCDMSEFICRYCSKLLSPIDYRFNAYFTAQSEKHLDVNKTYVAIAQILEKLKNHPDKLDLEMFLLALKIEVINGITFGKLFECFSAKIASSSLLIQNNGSRDMELIYALLFSRLYLSALKGNYANMVDSYSNRIIQLQKIYGVSRRSSVREYLSVAKRAKEMHLDDCDKRALSLELEKVYKGLCYSKLILQSYKEDLVKIKTKDINSAFFAGDLPNRVNGLTFIRENII